MLRHRLVPPRRRAYPGQSEPMQPATSELSGISTSAMLSAISLLPDPGTDRAGDSAWQEWRGLALDRSARALDWPGRSPGVAVRPRFPHVVDGVDRHESGRSAVGGPGRSDASALGNRAGRCAGGRQRAPAVLVFVNGLWWMRLGSSGLATVGRWATSPGPVRRRGPRLPSMAIGRRVERRPQRTSRRLPASVVRVTSPPTGPSASSKWLVTRPTTSTTSRLVGLVRAAEQDSQWRQPRLCGSDAE